MGRIIAGTLKGRRLAMPNHDRTRPTTDRVREAAFTLIADWAGTLGGPVDQALAGLSFLDLYAGSGAVGLEAASRGASPVWAVESDRGTAAVARKNADSLKVPLRILTRPVAAVLAEPPSLPFDIVWADPPYALSGAVLRETLDALEYGPWLAPGGLAVVERSKRDPAVAWPASMADSWQRGYGETVLYFAMRGDG